MKIVSIEPTPSPNSMKLNMDEPLETGVSYNVTPDQAADAPLYIQRLLEIEGVRNVFQVADFIALERNPRVDWEDILSAARAVLEEADESMANTKDTEESSEESAHQTGPDAEHVSTGETKSSPSADSSADTYDSSASFGDIKVEVQMYKGIPMQLKLTKGTEEERFALPDRFMKAAMEAQESGGNLVLERKWVEWDPRYGETAEVGEQVTQEIDASYDQNRLDRLVARAGEADSNTPLRRTLSPDEVLAKLDSEDWKVRYAALERLALTEEDIPVLAKALTDSKMSVRRLATAFLGEIGTEDVLPHLYRALKEDTVAVRRTAGDCLSDIGNKQATGPMIEALNDDNKLVRWRAARFLYEVGDDSALDALREAEDDPEYEVRMQVKMAIERIEGGHEAEGSVWQQMTRAFGTDKNA